MALLKQKGVRDMKATATELKVSEADKWINELSGIAKDTGVGDKELKMERILDKRNYVSSFGKAISPSEFLKLR